MLQIKRLSAFDPAFTTLDAPLLLSFGVSLLTENTVSGVLTSPMVPDAHPLPYAPSQYGRHPLPDDSKEATIVYMPHCPRALYQNVLASNWTEGRLGRVILLANELDGYLTRCDLLYRPCTMLR